MFGRKKFQTKAIEYNSENEKPVIKCSICNGEQVAGLKDLHTGHFTEIMLIKNDEDLETFKKLVNINEVQKEY